MNRPNRPGQPLTLQESFDLAVESNPPHGLEKEADQALAMFSEKHPSATHGIVVRVLGRVYYSVLFALDGTKKLARYALRPNGEIVPMETALPSDAHPDAPEYADCKPPISGHLWDARR